MSEIYGRIVIIDSGVHEGTLALEHRGSYATRRRAMLELCRNCILRAKNPRILQQGECTGILSLNSGYITLLRSSLIGFAGHACILIRRPY